MTQSIITIEEIQDSLFEDIDKVAPSKHSTSRHPKPPLKWAGGKRWLVPYLEPIWKAHQWRRLVEPFSGGLAIALSMMPSRAILNDINPHSINFYEWLKQGLQIDIPMENDHDLYYEYRKKFNHIISNGGAQSKEAAELFYYLNRTGYNGLCRFNRKGQFNVPFGRYKRINYVRDFSVYKRTFINWTFRIGDFENISLNSDDFVYADPPYDVEFTQYSKEGFNWQDQVRLVKYLANHPGPVVLSNQATARIIQLYKEYGFSLIFLDAPRMINCTGDRSSAKEVLATKGI